MQAFDTYIFDLDNTLYPAKCNLFAQIDVRMGAFIEKFLSVPPDEARRIQKAYFRDYGTTLNGLMVEHNMEPAAYLSYVHDIDHTPVRHDPQLVQALNNLPGRKVIFTNGTRQHAKNVLDRLGITAQFDWIQDIVASDYAPKPAAQSYETFIQATRIDPARAIFFEDIARNLEHPHRLGMTTVLVRCPEDNHPEKQVLRLGTGDEPYVDHVTYDLAGFLSQMSKPAG